MKERHTTLVKALAKDGDLIINGLIPSSAHLLHMAVGLSGEVGELIENRLTNGTHENRVEEFGDIEFYYNGIINQFKGISREIQPDVNINFEGDSLHLLHLSMSASNLLDVIKKFAIYESPLNLTKLTFELHEVRRALINLYHVYGITLGQAIEANIRKLRVRYESGTFTNEQAQLRADKSE